VYDYVDGKVDWMAYGLPVEGEDGPFVGQAVIDAVTVDVGATVGQARRRLHDTGTDAAIVTHGQGLAVGEVDGEMLAAADDDDCSLLAIMRPVPSTVRPSATVSSLAGSNRERVVVTTSDGHLLGQAMLGHDDHDHHEDHGHDDHEDHEDHDEALSERLHLVEAELDQVMEAVAAHFGDRAPPEEELRSFLRDRLVAEGRSPEEADQFMAELDTQNSE